MNLRNTDYFFGKDFTKITKFIKEEIQKKEEKKEKKKKRKTTRQMK